MKSITVNASKPYKVMISDGFFGFSLDKLKHEKIMIVTDEKVAALYLKETASLFACEVITFVIKSGEKSKNIQNYTEIVEKLYENGFKRSDAILSLGGGVCGDLAGFVASTFMRGIALYHMPTTLISVTDSSVGGKTAIDVGGYKNAVGTFYQPSGVFINTSLLKTLEKPQIQNGLGEIIKYAFLTGTVDATEPLSEETIYECIKYKKSIVEKDEFDNHGRALLNLGHTVGHAIETLSNYSLEHGVCVFKGLCAAVNVSRRIYGFSDEKYAKLVGFLNSFGLNGDLCYTKEQILNKIKYDKKNEGGGIKFIAVQDFGDVRIERLSLERLGELL